MDDKTAQSSVSNDNKIVSPESSSTTTGANTKKDYRCTDSSIDFMANLPYTNEELWEDLEKRNSAMLSEWEEFEKKLELMQELEEQLEKADAKSPNYPNKNLSYIVVGSFTVMLTFYLSILGLAILKERQSSAKEHKGEDDSSMILLCFGVTIGVLMFVWSMYSPRDLIRTRFVKLCLWVLWGIMIAAPVLFAIECFGSLYGRRFAWICLSAIWLLAGILYYMKTSCGRVLPVSTRNIPPNGNRA